MATALTGVLPTHVNWHSVPEWKMPERFAIDDSMVPAARGEGVEIIRRKRSEEPPKGKPFSKDLEGEVLLKLGEKITTDHINSPPART